METESFSGSGAITDAALFLKRARRWSWAHLAARQRLNGRRPRALGFRFTNFAWVLQLLGEKTICELVA